MIFLHILTKLPIDVIIESSKFVKSYSMEVIMVCNHCHAWLEDDPEICPMCGKRPDEIVRKSFDLYQFIIKISDFLALIMNGINIYLLLSSAHYAKNLTNGLFYAKQVAYIQYPTLIPVDIIFGIFLLILPVITTLSHYWLKKKQNKGLFLTVAGTGAIAAWSILYPIVTYTVTGIRSPVIYFWMVVTTIYVIVTVAFSAYFLKRDLYV